MKNNKKVIGLVVMGMVFGGSMTGFAIEKESSDTVKTASCEQLTIDSPANDVVIQETTGNKITASMSGHKGTLLKKNGKKLSITLPEPKAGMHFASPKVLYIKVPKKNNLSIHVRSEAGNIKLDGVRGKEITVDAQAGKISAANLSGNLHAKSEIGEIKAASAMKKDITQTQDGGATYEGHQGNRSDGEITLNNAAGEIELK